ncbi:cytochrome c1 [Parvibaculum sp.]|uniref:cytochrome c1 n=1 Tax=Parvibaculum sp. TaxID=2024848 RepID=UPI002C5918B3|nr:cytochrome c1 [Parvibaculum sp.]HUD52308.1 cytochrome c1 [Parvibaculum sp.]
MTQKMIEMSSRSRFTSKLAGVAAVAAVALGFAFSPSAPARAEGGEAHLKHVDWSFEGPFGTYDRSALRRGYKVYKEVCSTCHSMDLVHFRNLGEPGGPEFTTAEVKAIAAEYKVQDGPDQAGDMYERPGEGKDPFPSPYPNEEAAAASLGAAPPDLSLVVKAREGGADYVYSLLTSYQDAPADVHVPAGGHYNPVFAAGSGIIAMPQPISDGQVDYEDGTPNTLDQMAKDVTEFLMWAAEPKLEQRHRLGLQVAIYLIALAGILYFATRKVWSDQH